MNKNFTQEELIFLEQQQANLDNLMTKSQLQQTSSMQMALSQDEQNRSMIKDQLDLSEELDTIEHLLRGHILVKKGEERNWEESTENSMKVLTEHGIYLFMNTLMFYINKDTLLSNYDIETINKKMFDFATDLADTIFMEYEHVFLQPTFKECKDVLLDRIGKKAEIRKFAYELMGINKNEKEIKLQFIKEIEERIEEEMAKISEQLKKGKHKRFLILMRQVQDIVHSTYLRAYGGQERKTLRQHYHISENVNPQSMPNKSSKMNPLNWGR